MLLAGAGCSPSTETDGGAERTDGALPGAVDGGSVLPPIHASIDFEDLSDGETVTDQYGPEVIFSSEPGFHVEVLTFASQAGAAPNFICTRPDGGGNCGAHEVTLAFSAPLSSLSLFIPGVGVQSSAGRLAFLDADDDVLETRDLVESDNVFSDPPAGTRAVRFVDQTDGGGIGIDDFVITLQP
jgi:hypothetical protein